MHWVIQAGMYNERGFEALLETLERLEIRYTVTKCRPFIGTLEPEVEVAPGERTLAMGTVTMANVAKKRGWLPGSFLNDNFDFEVQLQHWGKAMLNHDAWVSRLEDVQHFLDPHFLRPTIDSKSFSGQVMDWGEFSAWRDRVLALTPEDGSTITPDTRVMVCSKKQIYREARLWVIDQKVVTASFYKTGLRVMYDPNVDPSIIEFGTQLARQWSPARAYCLDVCDTNEGPRIVEVNNLNSAGFYAADMNRLVQALESMPEDTLYPDRNVFHRNMGPPDLYPCCGGRGWRYETVAGTEDDYIPDYNEVYCTCAAGLERKRVD